MKKLSVFLLGSVFLVGIYLSWRAVHFLCSAPTNTPEEVLFEVPTGTPFYQVSKELSEKGLIKDEFLFKVFAKVTGQTTRVKVGEYKLSKHLYPRDILRVLTSGNSISYAITIPEGFNLFEIKSALNNLWPGRGEEFFKLVTDKKFIYEMTGIEASSLEGYLFPETYTITKYTPTETLVRRMVEGFKKNVAEVNLNAQVKLSLHDQVILASVIEKETGAAEERPVISSVFHNRLKMGMRLQSDPTIMYGMQVVSGEPVKNIKKEDILRPTPYNTYTVKALPVGPISNPGRAALAAAVNPIDSKYLYFVSKNDGRHTFTENYAAHEKAVKSYQLDRKAREGRSWRELNKKAVKNL